MTMSAPVAICRARSICYLRSMGVMDAFKIPGLAAAVGSMSATVLGDAALVALRDGFLRAAETDHAVMTGTGSNACPAER